MAKNAPKPSPEVVEQEAVNNVPVDVIQETADIEVPEEIEPVELVEEISEETAAEDVIDTDLAGIAEQGVIDEQAAEDQQGSNNEDMEQVQDSEEPHDFDSEVKYKFSAEVLEEYLSSYKAEDKIVQESIGGNFVSNRDHSVYVPLSLFVK
jgi:hypothetical protein